jgi:hypothetical protein
MSHSLSCPPLCALEGFTLGQITEDDAAALERHLAQCECCLKTLHTLKGDDMLTQLVQGQAAAARPPSDPLIDGLIHRLKVLCPGTPAPVFRTPWAQTGEAASASTDTDFLAPPEAPGEIGRLASYRILKVLGSGGMGIVFHAEDVHLGRPVALKALRPALAASAAARQRFLREARSAAALADDHIIKIYHVGEDRGIPFLAMELLEGETLENRLRREGKLPASEVIRIGREVAAGLAAAHAQDLIHRDVTPANILLERATGKVKLVDFGLARAADDTAGLTGPGVLAGTPAYMSPEQARGLPIDCRCDLFSLGSVLYALCAGRPPFPAESALAVLRQVESDTPPPVRAVNPEIPDWLAALIGRLHEKEPADRIQSAAEVVNLLGKGGSAKESRRPPRLRQGRRWLVAAAVVLGFGTALGLSEGLGVTRLTHFLAKQNAVGDDGARPEVAMSEGNVANEAAPPGTAEERAARVYPTALLTFEERGIGVKEFGSKITDLLFTKLAAKEEILLVDRNDLKKVLQEQELSLSGVVKPGETTKIGQLTGAKLLVTGAVFQADKNIHIVAKVIGTETSRVVAVAVEGKTNDELAPLVDKLAEQLSDQIARGGDKLVAKPVQDTDRLAVLNRSLKKGKRPIVLVAVAERHVGQARFDPAAQTELIRFCKGTGFDVIDSEQGSKAKADVLITGEAFSEFAIRHGNLVSVKARLEVKASDRKTDKVLAVDRQTVVVVDLAEQVAGKTALERAAAAVAERLLPQLVKD